MRQAVDLAIGGVSLRVEAAAQVLDAVITRFGAFVSDGPASVVLRVEAAGSFAPELERDSAARITADGEHAIVLSGAAEGRFDLATRRGSVAGVSGLGPVDSLMRAALSLVLPDEGALLVHGALVPGLVFAGASGAGKSTAAHALGALCDELVVLRPSDAGVTAWSTPYWQGRPWQGPCDAIVCLRRASSELPRASRLDGARAVRALLPNVVRYASLPRSERAILELAAITCAHTRIIDALCPEGGAYVPFIHTLMRDAA